MEVTPEFLEYIKAERSLSFQDEVLQRSFKELNEKKENVIKDALLKNGFNYTNHQFLADNFTIIRQDGDPFEHLYYHYSQPEQIRIVSIEHSPTTEYNDEGNKYTANTTYKYY